MSESQTSNGSFESCETTTTVYTEEERGYPVFDLDDIQAPFYEERGKIKQLIPFGTRVLVKRDAETRTEGGIFIPDKHKECSLTGTVIAVGDQCGYLEIGDQVFFARFSGKMVAEDLAPGVKQQFEGVMMAVEDDITSLIRDVAFLHKKEK